MEQRDINSCTRADTFGLRPDLYDALAGNMVKKEDLTTIGGSLGWAKVQISNSDIPRDVDKRLLVSIVGESKGVSIVDLNGRGNGVIMENGIWVVSESVTTRASGSSPYDITIKNEWAYIPTGNLNNKASTPQYVNIPFISTLPRGSYSHTFLSVVDDPTLALVPIVTARYTDSATLYDSSMTLLRIQ